MKIRRALPACIAVTAGLLWTTPIATATAATAVHPNALYGIEILNGFSYQHSLFMCLDAKSDAPNSPHNNGDKVQLWTCSGASNQLWDYTAELGNWGNIYNEDGYKCLDAQSDAPHNPAVPGDGIQLYDCNGSLAQQWRLIPLANGSFAIQNRAGNLVLDAATDPPHNPDVNGDTVQLWSFPTLIPIQQQWYTP